MNTLTLGAFWMALAIGFGAFGAHALGDVGPDRTRYWSIASHYHLIAAIGLMLFGLFARLRPMSHGPAVLLLAGTLLFSGSLYAMGLGGPRALGAITPVGGLALIAGFVWFGVAALGR